jgi:hypothetical protein
MIVNYWGNGHFCIKADDWALYRRLFSRRLRAVSEKTKVYGATSISRMPASCFARRHAPASLAFAAFACLILAACSPGVDYPSAPSLFPAVHDMPPPRTDTTLDANQVQQATEDLITARDRLNTEAQGGQSKASAAAPAKPTAKSSANGAGKPSADKSAQVATARAAAKKPSTQLSGREMPREVSGSDAAAAAGTETK